ncbi:hypothetical protein ACQKM2_35785 [Streptomyces sp. NPDC004126]|uniref:hypothetical protein n=1 Tax=Streptomyces sp. NPDC004126 TaxID=3390695 RepID=UPI003D05EC1C
MSALRRALLAGLSCLAVLSPSAPATAATVPAPAAELPQGRFADFLKVQGTFCLPDGAGGCAYILPGVPNMLYWGDLDSPEDCALVDYAGLAAEAVRQQSGGRISLGTSVTGTVSERPRTDGNTDVRIRLHTEKALTYVVKDCDLVNGAPLFGRSVAEVLAGTRATLGEARLDLELINNVPPGGELPDLVQLLVDPHLDQVPVRLTFRATAAGPLRAAFGVPDGTPGKATVDNRFVFADIDNRRQEIRLQPRKSAPAPGAD